MQFHKDGTLPPDGSWIFVFGSNLAGRHGAGAAKAAAQRFGAQYGVGKGRTGQAYALPTKDEELNTLSLDSIAGYINRFDDYAELHPELNFWMTRVGCGLAGHRDEDIAPMFDLATVYLPNISWPENWSIYFQREGRSI